jgi:hypothetical protein
MGALATCTVVRTGNKNKSEEDSQRLGLDLNADNKWSGTFTGTILHFENVYAYVVKDTANTLHLVKLSELSVVEAIIPA